MTGKSQKPLPTPNLVLKKARQQLGLSQQELADGLNYKTTAKTVARWEAGTLPQPAFRRALCNFFGKTEEELDISPQRTRSSEEEAISLPPTLSPPNTKVTLVGREADYRAIKGRLLSGGITILTGLAGVGKTTLSIQVTSDPEVRLHFKDSILWCSLGYKPNVEHLLSSWGLALGFSSQKMTKLAGEQTVAAIRAAIGERPLCVVLDDIWESIDAHTLLQAIPAHCSVLMTSRFPIVSADLAVGDLYTLEELSEEDGLHLLTLLTPHTIMVEPQLARELVKAVGGLPLALQLMAHYLHSQSPTGNVRRIQSALRGLSDAATRLHLQSPDEQKSPRHPSKSSLLSVIALTENLLEEPARSALYALSILPAKPNRISEATALAVANCDSKILDRLQDLGLLETVDASYRMHQTIADYSFHQLTPTALQGARERLLAYVLQRSDERGQAWMAQESPLVILALEAAVQLKKVDAYIHLVFLCAPVLLAQAQITAAQVHLQQAIAYAQREPEPPGALPNLLQQFALTFLKAGNAEEALALFQEALQLARQRGDNTCACDILGMLAWHFHLYGEYKQAETYLREGLVLATSLSLTPQLWVLWRVAGSQAWARGDYTQAEEAYQRGLSLAEAVPEQSRTDLPIYYCFLAVLAGERGHYQQAETYYQQGLLACEVSGSRDFAPLIIARRAMMRLMCSPSPELREELQQALHTAQEANALEYVISLLKAMAQLELALGNLDQAEQMVRDALRLIEPFGAQNRRAENITILAQIALARGNYEEAERHMGEVLNPIRQYGAAEDQAIALATWGELALAQGHLKNVEIAYRELFQVCPTDFLAMVGYGHYGLARLAAARRRWREAWREGEKSLQILETLGHIRAPEVRAWLDTLHHPLFSFQRYGQKHQTF